MTAERAHALFWVERTTGSGNQLQVIPNAYVTIYEAGSTSTQIAATMYAEKTGSATLVNPLRSDPEGMISFYLDAGQRITIAATATLGGTPIVVNDYEVQWNPADLMVIGTPSSPISLYQRGPTFYDVEAYASATDLTTDGTFKIDVDAVPAINAAAAAIRAATIGTNAGSAFGFGQARTLIFNSPIYTISSAINLTKLDNCVIESGCGTSTFYCGNSWTGGGVAATDAAMIDVTGTGGTLFRGLRAYAQPLLGPAGTAPTVKPAAGWLVACTETYNGSAWVTNGNSNNNTFDRCSAVGWFTLTGWAFINSVIHRLVDCGGQAWNNASYTHSLYIGRTTLGVSGPSTSGSLDSSYYPNPASPVNGSERLERTESSSSDYKFHNCEFHDMARFTLGGPGQSALASTILLYKTAQLSFIGGPNSSSGLAVVEVKGSANLISFDTVEFYDDASGNPTVTGSSPNYILFNNACTLASPAQSITFRNCILSLGVAVAAIGGASNAAYNGLRVESCQHASSGTALFNTNSSFSGTVTDEYLTHAYLECGGRAITVGGSVSASCEFIEPGSISVSGGGANKARTHASTGAFLLNAGGMQVFDGLTLSTGNLIGSNGAVSAHHFAGNGTALSSSDIAIAATNGNWGSGAAVSAVAATDYGGSFLITAAGTPGASPTVTLTFKTSYATQPKGALVQVNFGTGITTAQLCFIQNSGRPSTTQLVFNPFFTPVAGSTYGFTFEIIP